MFVHFIHLVSMHSWSSSPSLFNRHMLFISYFENWTEQMSQIIRCLEQSNIHRVDLTTNTIRTSVEEKEREKINLSVQCHREILDRLSFIHSFTHSNEYMFDWTSLRSIIENITLDQRDMYTYIHTSQYRTQEIRSIFGIRMSKYLTYDHDRTNK